jgi:hypothetical protein
MTSAEVVGGAQRAVPMGMGILDIALRRCALCAV